MSERSKNRFPFAKIVAFMAISFLVGVGLCGLDFALGAHGLGKPHQEFSVGPLDGLSLVVMIFSAVGLVLSLVAWMVAAIIGGIASGNRDQERQRLSGEDDPPKRDRRD